MDYYFVHRLHIFLALLLGLVLAVSNDYPTLNGSSHGASSRDRHRRWLYWTYYAALAMLLVREIMKRKWNDTNVDRFLLLTQFYFSLSQFTLVPMLK